MEHSSSTPTIVFDLDETLIHSTPIRPLGLDSNSYFKIVVWKKSFYVQTRPYLNIFLERVSKLYNICVFTSSDQLYANRIIDQILPNVNQCNRFFRNSCISIYGYFVKDLNLINNSLQKTLLIDDSAGSALKNPANLIKIKPWNGEKDDNVLENLLYILEKIAFDNDLTKSYIKILQESNFEGIGVF